MMGSTFLVIKINVNVNVFTVNLKEYVLDVYFLYPLPLLRPLPTPRNTKLYYYQKLKKLSVTTINFLNTIAESRDT